MKRQSLAQSGMGACACFGQHGISAGISVAACSFIAACISAAAIEIAGLAIGVRTNPTTARSAKIWRMGAPTRFIRLGYHKHIGVKRPVWPVSLRLVRIVNRPVRAATSCANASPNWRTVISSKAVTRTGLQRLYRRTGLSGNGFGECDGYHEMGEWLRCYHEMGDLRLALLNPTDRSHDGSGRM